MKRQEKEVLIQDNLTEVVHLRINTTTIELAATVAASRGQTLSSFIREAILLELLPFLPKEQQKHLRRKHQ